MKNYKIFTSEKDKKTIRTILDYIHNNDCTVSTLSKQTKLKKHFLSFYYLKIVHITQYEQRILLTSTGEDLLCYLNSMLCF